MDPDPRNGDGPADSPTSNGPAPPDSERLWATAAHVSGALVSFAGPLAVRVFGPPGGPWLRRSVASALDFQVVVFLAWLVTLPISWIPCIGWVPNALVLLANAVLSFIGAIQAYDAKLFAYPVHVSWFRARADARAADFPSEPGAGESSRSGPE